jgi:hypothetical protein
VVGVLGVTLPIVLALWGFLLCHCFRLQPSISDYYGLRTRDAFVGILFTIGWFLFTYKGYERKDDIAGNLACVFAICVALFPNSGTPPERVVHFGSSLGFFLVLSYFSLFLFTKSQPVPTPQKRVRNSIYRVCGVTILLCLALIGWYHVVLGGPTASALPPVFVLESAALWAFGISWFIKGDTLFKDAA